VDRCDECGFAYDEAEAPQAAGAIRAGAGAIAELLVGTDDPVSERADAAVWSPLEYACHVRDVLLVQRERVLLARRSERPAPEPMGRDERVDHDGYSEQAVDAVARQLTDAALLFATVLDRLDGPSWDRRILYNHPAPQERTLRWVAVHTVHEVTHHLADVRRQIH
jgi:hypothetical protein